MKPALKSINSLLLAGCLILALAALWLPRDSASPLARVAATPPVQFMHDIPLEDLERSLREIAFTPEQQPVLGEQTEPILQNVLGSLPGSSEQELVQRLEFLVRRCWPEPEAEALIALTRRYLQLARELPKLDAITDGLVRLDALKTLRRQYFSEAEAAAMFGPHEMLTGYLLQRQQIQQDTSIDDAERMLRLKALDAQMQEPQP